ncbi:hypothetical protein ACFWJU_06195 [Streptomyces mutabilis]|uniref:hypothetical protein n=1 Tax=Streptomyces mutabilis TaxID=67332 RepID=UPI0036565C73
MHPFTAYVDGMPRVVRAGDLVEDSDPVMRGRTHLFESVDDHVAQQRPRATVETATADPGEPRALTGPTAVSKDGDGKPPTRRGRGSSK